MNVLRSSALMVLVALYVQCCNSQGTPECVYRYEEQPRRNLECNPYLNNVLRLICRVEGPPQLTFTPIRWYWVPLNTQQLQRLNQSTGKYMITSQNQQVSATGSRILRSQLRVFPLNDSDAGRYFCRAGLSNGTLLTPSNELILNVQSAYTVSAACSDQPLITTNISCASIVTDDTVTVQPTTGTTGNTGNTGNTNSATTDANNGPTNPPSIPSPNNTPDDTPVPTPTTTLVAPEPESSSLQVALYIVVAVIVVICAITVTLAITIVILYRKKCGPKKTAGTSASYYSYPSPQPSLHESADGDYIDPSAASPLYHNLTPEAASTEMGPPDERKEVYQRLDPTSVDYTSLYMTTNMQGSVAPTVQEGGREYVIVDSRKRDPPNLYATATTY